MQARQQLIGQLPFLRAERGDIPFRAIHVVHGNESRFAALGQANIRGLQGFVDVYVPAPGSLAIVPRYRVW